MIFVSYSHKDEIWKDRVVSHLQLLTTATGVSVWQDRQIRAGQEWLREIQTALSAARVAVLLISVEFLNSPFITSSEVPKLLARREKEGLKVIPILVRPCAWQKISWLAPLQMWPRDARPLSDMDQNAFEDSLARLVEQIAADLNVEAPSRSGVPGQMAPEDKEHFLMSEINKDLLATSEQLGSASCSLIVVDRDAGGKFLRFKSAYGPNSEKVRDLRIPADTGIAGLVFTRNIPHRTNNLPGENAFAPSVARKADLTPKSMVTVPIRAGSEVIGVAQFVNKVTGPFVDEDIDIAMKFSDRIGRLLKEILDQPADDQSYEGVRECSIVFTDITNYGLVADSSELPVTSKLLNEYLTIVCDVALAFGFWIDKFLGDGVMVVANAPRTRREYALDSIRLAVEVEKQMANLIADWIRFDLPVPISNLRSRIGIATGPVYLGNIGHPKVHWYTAIGPSVNLAWRLLELGARDADCIMICPRTYTLAQRHIRTERVVLGYKDISSEPGVAYRVRGLVTP